MSQSKSNNYHNLQASWLMFLGQECYRSLPLPFKGKNFLSLCTPLIKECSTFLRRRKAADLWSGWNLLAKHVSSVKYKNIMFHNQNVWFWDMLAEKRMSFFFSNFFYWNLQVTGCLKQETSEKGNWYFICSSLPSYFEYSYFCNYRSIVLCWNNQVV